MSQATKRKHVVKEVLGDFVVPTENQQIVKVTGSRGNNLHEAVTAQGEMFLVSMPTKFRKNIWIKRGDYVIVDPIEEGEKVKAEISTILYKDHIMYLQENHLWPVGFVIENKVIEQKDKVNNKERKDQEESSNSNSDDNEDDLFVNTNRCTYQYSESEDDEDSDAQEDDDTKR
ncbi:probable RNA-binding protein EIF1AD [Syngnathus scovelli]|uniref:probable RNA-binding protein EIF1AD n=1 Tax=Syngnathus scovelli TaxID=161590 RepID=UPI00210F8E57|nr:probable RNA-binding protein EIF1AD [Syngnathus scovelli]